MYDYVGHLKKFGFKWNHTVLGFRFEIKIDSKKIKIKILFIEKYKKKYIY